MIKGTEISIIRGDSATINLNIKDKVANEEYVLDSNDIVRFSVKKDIFDNDIIIQKEFHDNQILLTHEDTKDLEFGEYVYDVELQFQDGQRDTIIPPSRFILLAEVHNK
jgi:hypothetical protein